MKLKRSLVGILLYLAQKESYDLFLDILKVTQLLAVTKKGD